MSKLLIGLDIGGTKSAAVLGDASGRVIERYELPTSTPRETIARLCDFIRRQLGSRRACACGISCGGPLSSRRGVILSPPNLPGWDEVPVVKWVSDSLGVPTVLENDANAAALAEWHWGLDRKVDDLVYLTCGTGQGAGIILGGRLHRGSDDLAGEIGHIRLLPLGPVGYRKAGSVEGLTSGRGLAALARLRLQEPHPPSRLDSIPLSEIDGKVVGNAAIEGDHFALSVVLELGDYLGQACAILIDLLNPQRISLGTMAIQLGQPLIEPVRAAARREALPRAFETCQIDVAALGTRVQDLAALAVADLAHRV